MSDEIQHHGIKGQKWGVRRFQNKDGSLTAAGKKRYQDEELDDGTYILKKGSEVHRVTANPEGEKKKVKLIFHLWMLTLKDISMK